MPFTFSHPAIILPFAYLPKKWFSLTGLIVGSLVPDFEYFLRMRIKSDYSHTLSGLFWFDLPLGILLAFIFHNIVRNKLFNNLPQFFKSRFSAFKQFNWNKYFKRNWAIVLTSILIGAFSHILWDSFTHHDGFFVRKISILAEHIHFLGQEIPIFKILQHSSTIIGAFVIFLAIYKLPADNKKCKDINLKYLLILVALTFTIVTIRFSFGLAMNEYGNIIVTLISAILTSLVLTSLIVDNK